MTEAILGEQLGVSRTPVREALRVLHQERLLDYTPNSGYVVRGFELKDLLDAYDVRGTLEAMACRLAAEQGITDETDARFASIMENSAMLVAGKNWSSEEHRAWRELNMSFHSLVLEVAGNRHLAEMAQQMRRLPHVRDPRLVPETTTFQSIYPIARARRSHEEHCEILDAIRQRQGTRAEDLMREHVWRNREALRKSLPYLAEEPARELP